MEDPGSIPPADGARVAVIDLGTNSTRLMVADVVDGEVRELERETRVTRLGRGVDLSGQLSAEGIEAVCAAVADYVATLRQYEPRQVLATATSAVRDASNGSAFLAELRERFALEPRVIDGESEAWLTYRGATAGRPYDDDSCLLVCDIGGGSTELIAGCGPEVRFASSIQAGVVRQTERHLPHDPPEPVELEGLATDVRARISEAITKHHPPAVDHGVAVAGTPTSLAAIDLGLDPYDPQRVHGHRLSLQTIQTLCSRLASMALAERFQVTGLQPERAPTIVAGVVILIQVMRAFGLTEVEVSEHDILHGVALDAVSVASATTPKDAA